MHCSPVNQSASHRTNETNAIIHPDIKMMDLHNSALRVISWLVRTVTLQGLQPEYRIFCSSDGDSFTSPTPDTYKEYRERSSQTPRSSPCCVLMIECHLNSSHVVHYDLIASNWMTSLTHCLTQGGIWICALKNLCSPSCPSDTLPLQMWAIIRTIYAVLSTRILLGTHPLLLLLVLVSMSRWVKDCRIPIVLLHVHNRCTLSMYAIYVCTLLHAHNRCTLSMYAYYSMYTTAARYLCTPS